MVHLRRLRGGRWVIRGQQSDRPPLPGHRMPLNHVPGQGGACAVAAVRALRVVPGGPGPAAGRGRS
eukprot:10413271-Alexandrium_andersonii.AAC.1